VHPREVLKPAILLSAAGIVVLHNHPSGDPSPSQEDRDCTERLVAACRVVGISLLDHVIIGESNFFSFSDAEGKKLC
jgi:DNA repair protein RadC